MAARQPGSAVAGAGSRLVPVANGFLRVRDGELLLRGNVRQLQASALICMSA